MWGKGAIVPQWIRHTFKISLQICEGGLASVADSMFLPHPASSARLPLLQNSRRKSQSRARTRSRLTTGGSVVQFAMPASARIVEVHDTAMKGGEANKAFPSYVCTVPRSICRALRINNEAYREEDHRSNKPDRCF
jgi:hypothetical protein